MSEKLETIQYLTDTQGMYTVRRLSLLQRIKLTKAVKGVAWFSTNNAGEPTVVVDQIRFYLEAERFIPFMTEACDRTLAEIETLDVVEAIGIFGSVVELNLISVAI